MTPISRAEWEQWQQDPITQAFYYAAKERIEEVKDVLAYSAGLESNDDNFNRGFLRAYMEMLDFRVDDLQEVINA